MKNLNNKTVVKAAGKRKKRKAKDSNPSLDLVLSLENLGCSITESTKDFSLINDNRDAIQNPNIKNDNIVKNRMIGTVKSFPNESDPFYDVGEELPQSKSSEAASQKIKDNSAKIKLLAVDLDLL